MRQIRDLGVQGKLLVAPAGSVIALVVLAVLAISTAATQRSVLADLNSVQEASRFSDRLGRIHANVYKVTSLASSSTDTKAIEALGEQQLKEIDALASDLAAWTTAREEKKGSFASARKALSLLAEYRKQCAGVVDLATADLGMANTYMTVAEKTFQEQAKALDRVLDDEAAAARAGSDQLIAASKRTMILFVVISLLGIGLTAALARAIARSIVTPLRKLVDVARALSVGDLDVSVDVASGDELGQVASAFRAVMESERRMATLASEVAQGNISSDVTPRSPRDRLALALGDMIAGIRSLVADVSLLAGAAVEGKLDTRADPAKHQGDFRKIVEGVNETLDGVIRPLEAAARCLEDISRGAIPATITAEYRGDFNRLKRSLNDCIDAVNALVADAGMLAGAAVDGKLATRADATRHQGDFRRIVEGVNATLDAVLGPVSVAAQCVEQLSRGEVPPPITGAYAGDFTRLKDNLNRCIDAVNRLVADMNVLGEAAVAGKLGTRADEARHAGDYRKIVQGVNRTLDAVLAPVNEAARVLEQLSRRDLRARVAGSYAGDHARIKDSVNGTAQALHGALAQVAEAAEQVSSAASQIASSSQAVASGASGQASSLAATTASIQSVAEQVNALASNAQQANLLARTARGAATEGVKAVETMQGAMARIKQSAEGTSLIIKEVSDIAVQTNLLALNAGVEAARAGDAGRGFGVVAEEVRSLALRAKEAAAKTEDLIRGSLKQAVEGEGAARHVAVRLGEIAQDVEKVTALVAEIATATERQTAAVGEVNRALGEVDRVTQQNAASAEESSSAASELSGQAEELAAMVGEFQLAGAAEMAGGRGIALAHLDGSREARSAEKFSATYSRR